ncbi:MAG: hypothetical protein K0B05_12375 [Bacteroidales bacterium]|nr:hypothetical protein [Bacteroidales bacterium]
MKFSGYKHTLFICALLVMPIFFLTSCNTKSLRLKDNAGELGILGFYLDMDYTKTKTVMDSLLDIGELYYFTTTDILGNTQNSLYYNFSEISPSLCTKVNLRGTYIVDERLTSIQLTLCSRSDTGEKRISYYCDLNEIKKLFELYTEKYGKPAVLGQGEEYNWLARRIPDVYSPGPKGRWVMDRIYYWQLGDYIIYFDFGYPESITIPDDPELPVSTIAPIILYDFTPGYLVKLLDKAGKMKDADFK